MIGDVDGNCACNEDYFFPIDNELISPAEQKLRGVKITNNFNILTITDNEGELSEGEVRVFSLDGRLISRKAMSDSRKLTIDLSSLVFELQLVVVQIVRAQAFNSYIIPLTE